MKKILWLTSWYPNKFQPFTGDFIQRHAQAVAACRPVHVIFVIKDTYGGITTDVHFEYHEQGDLSEVIAYYKPRNTGIRSIDRMLSIIKYLKISRQLIRSFIEKNGRPDLVHVHIALRAGLLANWLRIKYSIPYIVTEHWTGYQKTSLENIYNKGFLFRKLTWKVLGHSKLLLPVSRQLGEVISNRLKDLPVEVVSNVVDTRYFTFQENKASIFKFIHVSAMGYAKNVEGLLNGFSKLKLKNQNWSCVMVGAASTELKDYSVKLGLADHILWKGELTYEAVATEMKQSSAMVMFSRYENMPCVILEAHCCGLPVIATSVGGIPEIINDGNGILVTPGNEDQLLSAMLDMINNYQLIDRKKISDDAIKKYSPRVIGEQISTIYNKIISG